MSIGGLSYSAQQTRLLSWEFDNPQLSAQVTAFLATLLAFQVSGLIYDLILGVKTKNVASTGDLHMVLLTRRLSPLAISSNLFRRDRLTRLYYGRENITRDSEIARDPQKIKAIVVVRFLILLSVGPLCNIAVIVLSLRTQNTLTFADVQFESIGFTAIEDPSSSSFPQTVNNCTRLPVITNPGDTSLVQFTFCPQWANGPGTVDATASVRIGLSNNHIIHFIAQVGGKGAGVWKSLTLYTNDKLYSVEETRFHCDEQNL